MAPTALPVGASIMSANPVESARTAGLTHVTDAVPGIQRRHDGNEFTYVGPNGDPVSDPTVVSRIQALGIPPAWTDVWICPSDRGHLQATGRDAKGRKQYRYHPRWREIRDQTKYDRLVRFGETLPLIRERVEQDLGLPGTPREKVLAAVIRLLETTMIRIGNEEYARKNRSFGLTTFRNRHVDVEGSTLRFHFRGKSGKQHVVELHDRRLALLVRRCREIPGHHLFEYVDGEGQIWAVGSGDVNDYLREMSGQEFSAKDFRTWAGTLLAVEALQESGPCESDTKGKKEIAYAIDCVRERLGNTRAVCRRYYVHPAVIEAYLNGTLPPRDAASAEVSSMEGLSSQEAVVLSFLRSQPSAHGRQEQRAIHTAPGEALPSSVERRLSRCVSVPPRARRTSATVRPHESTPLLQRSQRE
jgi:DNA topoisomerase I